jgi:uncharacterized membrane protein HdeD (DUF308 family)
MEYVRGAKRAYMAISAVLIAGGIFLMLRPALSMRVLCMVSGIVIAVFGGIKLLGYFSRERFALAFQFDFALGIFTIIAGTLMIVRSANVVAALPVILGVFVLTDGAFKFQTALDAKRFGLEHWWVVLVLAALTCACGVVLVVNPFASAMTLLVALGISLVVDGVQNLCVVACTVQRSKNSEDKER